ncbi:riboflavin synthase [Petroclostridium sp. X23]|uniref:riboflavin synthase n=1 Tax=Petroclostridium sp. X23 TaxID=3045146 RepID=UPI0024AD756A|nr:riboflavin synthase [Petroclostridium sp. X23]WHH61725.1 riboflavin synthase [Petroclostridium sp. X23]
MFTGIVEEIGKVKGIEFGTQSIKLSIYCRNILEDVHIGDSISTNGVCLTVTKLYPDSFTADVMPETLRKTSLNSLKAGSKLNLERALRADGRLGGHFVTGHIDGTGTIIEKKREGNAIWIGISAHQDIMRHIVNKGSIAIDGTSLTVAIVDEKGFKVSLIPHTADVTILSLKNIGDIVNLECDILGKYIEKLMTNRAQGQSKGITMDFLMENGF